MTASTVDEGGAPRPPVTADRYAGLGATLLLADDVEGAEAAYDAALSLAPGDRDALVGKAQALLAGGRPGEAVRYLRAAAASSSDDADLWRLLGGAALAAGMGEEAGVAFSRLQSLAGADAETYLNLAVAAFYALDLERAREYATLALVEQPDNGEARAWERSLAGLGGAGDLLVEVGRAHCRVGRLERGVELFERALAADGPREARMYLGRALTGLGRYEEAAAQLEQALAAAPQRREVLVDLATARFFLGEHQRAAALYDEALNAAPDDTAAMVGRGQVELAAGHLDEAAELLHRALSIEADRSDAWFLLARVHRLRGEGGQLRAAADRALLLAGAAPAAWELAGRMLWSGAERGLARLYWDKAGSLSPASRGGPAESEQAAAAGDEPAVTPDPVEELAALDVLVASDPGLAFAYRDRATIYGLLGEFEAAAAYLASLWERNPADRSTALACERGDVARAAGRFVEAAARYEEALALHPALETATAALVEARRLQEADHRRAQEQAVTVIAPGEPPGVGTPPADAGAAAATPATGTVALPEPAASAAAAAAVPEAAAAVSEAAVVAPVAPADSSPAVCAKCGAPYLSQARFCVSCGAPRL